MNRTLPYLVCMTFHILFALPSKAQSYRHLLRGYDDNDGIDIRGMGTDEGYTNGTRLELLYRPHKARSFLYGVLPKAGDSSINTYGLGVMQVMYSPANLRKVVPDVGEYPYAGGLFAAYTFHSANLVKKLNLQSEIIAGVMGPPSQAAGFQKLVHRIGGFITPKGWASQLPTDLLLNYNFTAEKQVATAGSLLDCAAGTQLSAGTMLNSAHVYTMLRFGRKFSYYSGLIEQYTAPRHTKGNWQLYGICKPGGQLVLYNAMYEGGMLNKRSPFRDKSIPEPVQPVRWIARLDFGLVASSGDVSMSFMQSLRTREVEEIRPHSVGTISIQIAW